LYGDCLGVRSSRQIERRCVEDLAFRVLAANQTPDAKLQSDSGKACYAKRKQAIEPVFGQIKEQQGRGGSCAAGCVPAPRSGSCCAAPTT
jgi:Transposase DDE domain